MIGHPGRGLRVRTWARPVRWLCASLLVVAAGACDGDDPVGGPGPVGPIGPVRAEDQAERPGESDEVAGSGEIVSEERAVGAFDRVSLVGEGDVTIVFGEPVALAVETDDNLLDLIETTVDDGTLNIRTVEGVDIAPSASVAYRVVTPNLVEVAIVGAGSIDVGTWSVDSSRVTLTGVGDIRIESLDADSLVVEHVGIGSISIDGTVDEQDITVVGLGELDAADLESTTASIEVAGDASATVWVTDQLSVDASDTSTVAYFGSPDVTEQLEGLASITSLGDR